MMPCQEVRRLTERFVSLELSRTDEEAVRAHLQQCPACRAHVLAAEPAMLFAVGSDAGETGDAEAFVAGVMGGIRERRLERALHSRRRHWVAAAAVLAVAVLGGVGGMKLVGSRPEAVSAAARPVAAERVDEPPSVVVEGEDVRLYQVSLAGEPGVQVAFVVDPGLEL